MERSFEYDGVLVRPQKKFAETDYIPYYTSCTYLSYNKIFIAFFKYLIYVFFIFNEPKYTENVYSYLKETK